MGLSSWLRSNYEVELVDTTAWRTKKRKELYSLVKMCTQESNIEEIVGSGNEVLFNNNAARSCFLSLLGYLPGEPRSISDLARVGACISTCILLMGIPDGKGGRRNSQFKETFMALLPNCLSVVLSKMYRKVH